MQAYINMNIRLKFFQALLTMKAGSGWSNFFLTRRVLFINGLFGGIFVSFFKADIQFIVIVNVTSKQVRYNITVVVSFLDVSSRSGTYMAER